MHLGQITAIGAQLLPDIGYSIQPDYIHTLIGKEQQVLHHVVEDHGIGIV